MTHRVYRVVSFQIVGPYTVRVTFDDASEQIIDFQPVIVGEIYGPLREIGFFNQVHIDPEIHTLVWPNGADFDPETLHDWPKYAKAFAEKARAWGNKAA